MVTRRKGSTLARLLLAAMALACAAVWSVEARAERRGIAVIIGNSDYGGGDIPPVDYAYRDAEAFKRYVIDVLGYAEPNVIHMKDATRRQMLEVLGEPGAVMNDLQARLNLLGGEDAEVVVYYSGHGVPGGEKGQPYLLPVDVPAYAARREGYGTKLLYQMLGKLKGVKSVWVFLDTCFSGSSHAGRLVTGSPVYTDAPLPEDVGAGMMVLTAVTRTQIATWDKRARHGLFTQHLLEALYGGKGDQDRDGTVTAAEVKAYLDRYMTSAAWLAERRQQQATLRGHGGEVLASAGPGGVFPKRPDLEDAGAEDKGRVARKDRAPAVEPDWDHETKRLIQLGLNELKFETGSPDGIFGEKTREAIRKWQESKGLRATGNLTAEYGTALKAVGEAAERKKQELEAARGARLAQEAEARRQAALERSRREREAAERERTRLARQAAERERKEREEAARREEEMRPGREFQDCEEAWCPRMVVVAAGEFTMGSPDDEAGRYVDEGPRHEVRIGKKFAVGKYEVTFGEWDACVAGGGCGGYRPGDRGWGRGDRPVVNVSWEDAKGYVEWLAGKTGKGYRLLSESEWEYGARGGARTGYSWGGEIGVNRANCDGCGSRWDNKSTGPVGSFGANGYGLHDMHGNVWEWVEDCWHGDYEGAPRDGRAWTTGSDCSARVLRGGSWNYEPRYLRSALRFRITAGIRYDYLGFRVARTLTP